MTARSKSIRVAVLRGVGLANLMSAAFVFFYFTILVRFSMSDRGWNQDDVISGSVFIVYMAASSVIAMRVGLTGMRAVMEWLDEERPPTQVEVAKTLAIPAVITRTSFAFWLGAALVFGVLNVGFGNPASDVARISIGITMAGLIASAVVYLLVEKQLRPVFAEALAGDEPRERSGLGIGWRLGLAWVLGSAIPLLGVALAPLGDRPSHELSTPPLVALAVAGLVAGGVLIGGAARSVAAPLDRLRLATASITDGDLTTEVTVDDGGQIGMLQAGFNRMVSGLRDQDRIRELFGHYVGADVAREALEREVSLGGELREVSVLFVDLNNSTGLAERLRATEVVAVLNRFFATVVREVGHEDGWVNKFEGDGALCVFGAPVPQPDHAARGLRAARRLAAALKTADNLDAAIGVSSGLVVAGNVGAEQRYEYTVIGDPVNETARLTDLAKSRGARVYATESIVTAAGTPEAEQWRRLGVFELRGRQRPTVVYAPAVDAEDSALAVRSTPSSSTS